MEVVSGALGPEGKYDLKIEGGKIVAAVTYDGADLDGFLTMSLDLGQLKETVKKTIPGKIDDAVIDLLFAALMAA